MADQDEAIAEAARRHGFSEDAVRTLWSALVNGRGAMAQFNHPELGGMGQWSGGMIMIGDMFNNVLKSRVSAVCADLSSLAAQARTMPSSGSYQTQYQGDGQSGGFAPMGGGGAWWPDGLGQPTASGGQNTMRYACFPDSHRLVIEQHGHVTVYDTGEYRIGGFSQQQSSNQRLTFSSQFGQVTIDNFRVVSG